MNTASIDVKNTVANTLVPHTNLSAAAQAADSEPRTFGEIRAQNSRADSKAKLVPVAMAQTAITTYNTVRHCIFNTGLAEYDLESSTYQTNVR